LVVIDFVIDPLDRKVSPLWRSGRVVDLAAVSEMDLRYEYFWSRVQFVVDGFDMGAEWGRLPLLDFSASIKRLQEAIARSGSGVIDFTENKTVISFARRGDLVEVRRAGEAGVLSCAMSDLTGAIEAFIDKVATDLVAIHPDIARNEFFQMVIAGGSRR
jgi:hypothetical protein